MNKQVDKPFSKYTNHYQCKNIPALLIDPDIASDYTEKLADFVDYFFFIFKAPTASGAMTKRLCRLEIFHM